MHGLSLFNDLISNSDEGGGGEDNWKAGHVDVFVRPDLHGFNGWDGVGGVHHHYVLYGHICMYTFPKEQ